MATSNSTSRPSLLISIDLELDVQQRVGPGVLESLTRQLAELMTQHRLSATWAVSDPAVSAATETILAIPTPQEIAILGDANWVGPAAGRGRFARELARRTQGARDAEIDLQSLVLRDVALGDHNDLLVKHQIRAVRSELTAARRRPALRSPQSIRFGVFDLPASVSLPRQAGWLPGGSQSTVRRLLRQAAATATPVHLAIEPARLADTAGSPLASVAKTLSIVAERRDRGLLTVETLGQASAQLATPPQVAPARSILRRAA